MSQMADVQAQHQALELVRTPAGGLLVRGMVGFRIDYEGTSIEDSYEIEVVVPEEYPRVPPTARETDGDIPDNYHHKFLSNGMLCLGAPIEVKRAFAEHRTLLSFIDRQVIPYLFSHSCFQRFGRFPYGELRHGIQGVLDYYSEHFGTSILATMRLLKYLADYEFPQGDQCPCGSYRELCMCHGRKVLELWGHQSSQEFAADLIQIIMLYAVLTNPLDEAWWALDDLLPKRYPSLLEFWSANKAGQVEAQEDQRESA